MATAAHRGGGDPAAFRKRTKGPKTSSAKARSGVMRKRVSGSQRAEAREVGEAWAPYRSVATWYIWRSLDPLPVE